MSKTCDQRIGGGTCGEVAGYRFTWPGKDEAFICDRHVAKLRNVAQALNMHLQIIPLESGQPIGEEENGIDN